MTLNRMLNFVSFLYELLEGNDVQPDDLMEKNNLIEEKEIGRRVKYVRIELDKPDADSLPPYIHGRTLCNG